MNILKGKFNVFSLGIFVVTFIVYFFSVERTGSLWDCGEFILGAYKLQVVHPPGAPLFILIGRIFALIGDVLSSNPSDIAFAVNIMSGLFSALAAALVGKSTMLLSKRFYSDNEWDKTKEMICAFAGVIAGLATAFCSSIWFSAVEGEVYALSTFFTVLTFWAVVEWYVRPNERKYDRWLVFAAYSAGLSIGVHLLSLLTFPALALLIYFKKSSQISLKGLALSIVLGAASIGVIQKGIIVGIPTLWKTLDLLTVNSFGLPFHSGLFLTILILGAGFYYTIKLAHEKRNHLLQLVAVSVLMVVIGYSTIGVVVIRANADTPVNMNVPNDATRLLPYINREQYGERPLLYGPHYEAQPTGYDRERRYGRADFPPYYDNKDYPSEYVYVDEKITPQYSNADKMLFPRISHNSMGRPAMYKNWQGGQNPKPNFGFNLSFFFQYQVGWMYMRYFMWNFAGRQNGDQGFRPWDKSSGHWASGINIIDESRLYEMSQMPTSMKEHQAHNKYYMLPLLFGLIGLFYQFRNKPDDFGALFFLFLVTGIGIIVYSNQPPSEPRERDYVLIGSFFTFCIWIGMAIPAIYNLLKDKIVVKKPALAIGVFAVVLTAPLLMAFQNFDDHGRADHYASRDYAKNFLNSLDPNAILFTYGDNDTYPLWYVQEVENVRRDVRIVNLSLIAVDWYINKLRAKVNDSEPLKLTIPASAYRGNKRNQVPYHSPSGVQDPKMNALDVLRVVGSDNPVSGSGYQFDSYMPTHNLYIQTDYEAVRRMQMINPADSSVTLVPEIPINLGSATWIQKDDLAVLDVISSNIWDRPIYFATTCQNSKLLGLNDYMQYEGLALRIVPVRTPSQTRLQIYGSGRMETHRLYDNIMNKWVWGNFDKKKLHVNSSFAAALQAHRMVMLRTAEELFAKGETQKSIDIADKFFEAFPHMNFPYDAAIAPFLSVYIQAGAHDKAMQHMRILANETVEYLDFYASIDPNTVRSSFQSDFNQRTAIVSSIISLTRLIPDENFKKEMTDLLSNYQTRQVPN